MRRLIGFIVLVATAVAPLTSQQPAAAALPARLEEYFSKVAKLTAQERNQLIAGSPVTRLLAVDESKEVAVLGAVWINAPIARYVAAVKDIERFERGGGFKITKRISTPPRLEDFAQLRLPDEDIDDLKACRVGDCALKLGEQALNRFRTEIDWNAPTARSAANMLMQQLALDYVNRYLEGGNDQLAVYRDNARPTFVAQELRAMIDQMPELTLFMPAVRRYLLEYPRFKLPQATSFLYWQETQFGLKPTIRISHLTVQETADDAIVASKMLYANHYFWTGLELRVLTSDLARGPGFWFVTINRSRSDGLSGFTGSIVRGRVHSEVQEGTLAALKSTQHFLETGR
jgi:hypothetical protein